MLALVPGLVRAVPAPDDPTTLVAALPTLAYLLLGQSNAAGQALTSMLGAGDRARIAAVSNRVEVEQLHSEPSRAERDGLLHRLADPALPGEAGSDPRAAPSNYTLEMEVNGCRFCTFGPELFFALHMAETLPDRRIKVFKIAYGGADISMIKDIMYPRFLPALHRMVASLGADAVQIGGVFMVQGESDAGVYHPDFVTATETYASAARYGQELTALIRTIREDLAAFGQSQTPFAAVPLRMVTTAKQPHNVDVVNEQMAEVSAALPRVTILEPSQSRAFDRYMDGHVVCVSPRLRTCLGELGDCWEANGVMISNATCSGIIGTQGANGQAQNMHFTALGQKQLGRSFAEVFLQEL